MLKVVIFDSGWGGELFADFLEEELVILEVIRVIDWRNAPYHEKSSAEVCQLTEMALMPYLEKVDVIVLASNEVSAVALDYLKKKYPKQKFVGFGWEALGNGRADRVLVLGTDLVFRSESYQEAKRRCQKVDFYEKSLESWPQLIDDGEMTEEMIARDVAEEVKLKPDVVMLGCAHFVDVKSSLEKVFGWQTQVVDDYQPLMRALCSALGLLGGDGRRRR